MPWQHQGGTRGPAAVTAQGLVLNGYVLPGKHKERTWHPFQPGRADPAKCPGSGSQEVESLLCRASHGKTAVQGSILSLPCDLEASHLSFRLFPHSEVRKLSKVIPEEALRTPSKAQDDICILHISITAIAIIDGATGHQALTVSVRQAVWVQWLCHVSLRRAEQLPRHSSEATRLREIITLA